jgi:hypothetical protein
VYGCQLKKSKDTVDRLIKTIPEEMDQKIDESIEDQKLVIKDELDAYISSQIQMLQTQIDTTIKDEIENWILQQQLSLTSCAASLMPL